MVKEDVNSTLNSVVEMLIQEERYPEVARFLGELSEEEIIKGYETTVDSIIDKYLGSEEEEEFEKGIKLHSAAEKEGYDVREITEIVGDAINEENYKRVVRIYDAREDIEGFKEQVDSLLKTEDYDKAGSLIKATEDSELLSKITIENYINDAMKKKEYGRAVGLIKSAEELDVKDYVNEQVEKKKYNIAAELIQAAELDIDEIIEDEKVAAKVKHYLEK